MTLLKDKLKDKKLILASRSPRRRDLMKGVGLDFETAEDFEVEEIYPDDLPVHRVAEYLAELKSNGYCIELKPGEILITADTIVICEGKVLGKPHDGESAVRMLQELSGQRHTVITGVVIRNAEKERKFSVSTNVWFRELRDEEIEFYVGMYEPYDKAGAYGIQEWIGYVGIEKIEGSFYNVMGLPIQTLYVQLERFVEEAEVMAGQQCEQVV